MNKGRTTALHRHPISLGALVFLLVLLVLPVAAALRLSAIIPWYVVPAVMCVLSLWVYVRFAHDKKQAQASQRRVPESSLHLCELIGGWPGSFLAQRRFRHKIAKRSYQITFWLIVCVYQIVAFDYLNNWKFGDRFVTFVVE
jgi:uncharacterized membrane protein YsdA (DUF1294 family)